METKGKKKLFNIILAALIAVVVFCGVMAVGGVKGWFGGDESYAKADDVTGIVNIERNGVGYTLEKDTALRSNDVVETRSGAQADISAGKNGFDLAENTEASFGGIEDKNIEAALDAGEVFVTLNNGDEFSQIIAGDAIITAEDAVFSVNVQTGSMGVDVFEGTVKVKLGDENSAVKAGKSLSIVSSETSLSELDINSLNQFNIDKVIAANDNGRNTCFSNDKLNKVIADRNQETKRIKAEQEKHEKQVIAAGESALVSSGKESSTSSNSNRTTGSNIKTCTIQIRCDTILNNMGDLSPGKEKYVPKNGVILATSKVEFKDGETGFDILKRACNAAGIQLEYSYTPMYGSYYIEGINHLYEFDCGEQSGWMYKVNGWFPNYGCSSYKMKDGDVMVWCYTCKGLGADVGGSVR